MTHPAVIAQLSDEDLQRWRTWYARDDAMQLAPALYNRDEIESHFRQWLAFISEFCERYGVEDSPLLRISGTFGRMYYSEAD